MSGPIPGEPTGLAGMMEISQGGAFMGAPWQTFPYHSYMGFIKNYKPSYTTGKN